MEVENLGDRPILDLTLTGQVASWEMHDPRRRDQRPLLGDYAPYLQPGEKQDLSLGATQVTYMQISSCTVSWRDADGRLWKRDIDPAIANHAADEERRLEGMTPADRMREMFDRDLIPDDAADSDLDSTRGDW